MDPDFESLQQKRRERYQYQTKRAQKNKQLMIRLIAAVVILVVCMVGIFLVSRWGGTPQATTEAVLPVTEQTIPNQGTEDPSQTGASSEPTQTGAPTEPTQTGAPTEPPDTVIHIAAAGDLNITDQVVAAGGEAYNYTNTFQDVGHLLADADISVLNLEGNLVGEPYGSSYYSAPQSMAAALDAAGVDLIQLANSYSIRNGMSGLAATIDAVRAAGMEPIGAYASEEDYRQSGGYTIVTAQGIRVAFVAFTKGMDGMTLPPGNEDCVNVLYSDYDSTYQDVNSKKITTVINAVKRAKPDVIVAMLHWGSEFNDTISNSQKQIVELLQEEGVDAIIGTHSHYVQQMVFDPDKGTFLAYSLGNFLSDADRSGSEYSVILNLEITKDGTTGKTKITGYDYTPIFTVAEADKPLRVVRIQEAIGAFDGGYMDRVSQETYDKMVYALTRIEARIKGE